MGLLPRLQWTNVVMIICAIASVGLFTGSTDPNIRALSCIPVFVAVIVFLESPPPGKGVGQAAGPLPGLKFVAPAAEKGKGKGSTPAPAHAPPPLGDGGALLKGHAYVITFFNLNTACAKALPRVEKLYRKTAYAKTQVHYMLLSQGPHSDVDAFAKKLRSKLLCPIASDASGGATENFMRRFSCYIVPHCFVVNHQGTIIWHGQVNRRGLLNAVASVLKAEADRQEKLAGGGATPSKEGKKNL